MSEPQREIIGPATADRTDNIVRFPLEEATGSSAMALSRDYADLRERVVDLGANITQGHRQALSFELQERASKKAKLAPIRLLEELGDQQGLSWRAVAKLLGVTVQSIRKWRMGDAISGENRERLACLAAYLEMLNWQAGIQDPASWLETPIVSGVPLTPIDAYARGELPLLLEYSCDRVSGEALLSAVDPEWRRSYQESRWEVFEAEDGNLSIRARAGD